MWSRTKFTPYQVIEIFSKKFPSTDDPHIHRAIFGLLSSTLFSLVDSPSKFILIEVSMNFQFIFNFLIYLFFVYFSKFNLINLIFDFFLLFLFNCYFFLES